MSRVFTDPRCLEHAAPPGYPERPERLRAVLETLARGPWEVDAEAAAAVDGGVARRAVEALHEAAYVERFRRAVERRDGLLDSADNPLSPGTCAAAWGAVRAVLAAAEWVMGGGPGSALAAVRPPGHHAERERAMGFCFFNNVAVAAQHLLDRHGVERLAIVDFDVHHGNGTQHLFEARGEVLYVSLHQYPFYPGTGAASEVGRGPGEGATVNVPLAAGTGEAGYARAFEEVVLPALGRFAPEVLLVSAGFDAWRRDPLGGMQVGEAGFAAWGRWLGELAAARCGGRVLSVLEGGYDLEALPRLVTSYLEGLEAGRRQAD